MRQKKGTWAFGFCLFRQVLLPSLTRTHHTAHTKLWVEREHYDYLLPSLSDLLRFLPPFQFVGFCNHGNCVEAVEGYAQEELASQNSSPLRYCCWGSSYFSFIPLISSHFQLSVLSARFTTRYFLLLYFSLPIVCIVDQFGVVIRFRWSSL